jgi:DNA-binding NtrC family response regulator
MALFEKEEFDLVLLDLDMPDVSGMDILHDMNKHAVNVPVVVLTGVNDVDLAVKSMKLGAFDYLVKPVEDDKLLEVIDDAVEYSVLHKSIDELPKTLTHKQLVNKDAFEHLPTQDSEMIRLFLQAEKLADSDLSIFIWGESGTGKEALARAIHNASPRRDKPFIAIEANCFEPDQFPASFFGQVRGWSGTREEKPGFLDEANEGTLFLNHIEHLNHPMQTRLQRIIQTNEYYRENSATIRKVDLRMIVASTKDLTSQKYEKTFSRDLLYHLMINSIRIPPLRERVDDIPLLAEHFLKEEVKRAGKNIQGFSDECLVMLKQYNYPNNVQELLTIVASAVAREESSMITVESLPSTLTEGLETGQEAQKKTFEPRTLNDVIEDQIKRTLHYFNGDRKKAAERLGISPEKIDKIVEDSD